jgi:hypothetical protein
MFSAHVSDSLHVIESLHVIDCLHVIDSPDAFWSGCLRFVSMSLIASMGCGLDAFPVHRFVLLAIAPLGAAFSLT